MTSRRTSLRTRPITGIALGSLPGELDVTELRRELLRIESESTELPWSDAMFGSELAREEAIRVGAFSDSGSIHGFVFAALVGGAWHIMNIAVEVAQRRRGIAALLLTEVIDRAAGTDVAGYTLEVRESNQAAQALYRGFGFRARGVRRRYYSDNGEDALVMWRPPQTVLDQGVDPDAWRPAL